MFCWAPDTNYIQHVVFGIVYKYRFKQHCARNVIFLMIGVLLQVWIGVIYRPMFNLRSKMCNFANAAKHQASLTTQAIASFDAAAESSSNKASWVALLNLPPVSVHFGLRASLSLSRCAQKLLH